MKKKNVYGMGVYVFTYANGKWYYEIHYPAQGGCEIIPSFPIFKNKIEAFEAGYVEREGLEKWKSHRSG